MRASSIFGATRTGEKRPKAKGCMAVAKTNRAERWGNGDRKPKDRNQRQDPRRRLIFPALARARASAVLPRALVGWSFRFPAKVAQQRRRGPIGSARAAIEFFLALSCGYSFCELAILVARREIARIRATNQLNHSMPSFDLRMSLTACGLALPPVDFITCPTNQPSMPGLAFACRALSKLAAMTSSTALAITLASVT